MLLRSRADPLLENAAAQKSSPCESVTRPRSAILVDLHQKLLSDNKHYQEIRRPDSRAIPTPLEAGAAVELTRYPVQQFAMQRRHGRGSESGCVPQGRPRLRVQPSSAAGASTGGPSFFRGRTSCAPAVSSACRAGVQSVRASSSVVRIGVASMRRGLFPVRPRACPLARNAVYTYSWMSSPASLYSVSHSPETFQPKS